MTTAPSASIVASAITPSTWIDGAVVAAVARAGVVAERDVRGAEHLLVGDDAARDARALVRADAELGDDVGALAGLRDRRARRRRPSGRPRRRRCGRARTSAGSGSSTSPSPASAIERSITHTPSAPVASGAMKTSPAGRFPNAPGWSSTPSSSFHSRPVTSNVQSVPPGVVTRTRAAARRAARRGCAVSSRRRRSRPPSRAPASSGPCARRRRRASRSRARAA